MLQFILNNSDIQTTMPRGVTVLDFVRYHQNLTGTKIGCREGDCGACTVLIGEITGGQLVYRNVTSCLMPLGNVHRKHVVTIEGINKEGLTPVQKAFSDCGATQCGFCTPGFIVSLTGFSLSRHTPELRKSLEWMNGNICRCTGYKSIERAAGMISVHLGTRDATDSIEFAVDENFVPEYFRHIQQRLEAIPSPEMEEGRPVKAIGGGTDLYVQQHEELTGLNLNYLSEKMRLVDFDDESLQIGGSATVSDLAQTPGFQQRVPAWEALVKLISSSQIRNMATIAGNFVNASPIGDFTILFLALETHLSLSDGFDTRIVALREFYKGYKTLDKTPNEIIQRIIVRWPLQNNLFSFEKVCKRTHLDIASVNSALNLEMDGDTITAAGLSAGGVGPVPLFLRNASAWLGGKRITAELINELAILIQEEISPISDARGTSTYKRFLLSQLIRAHFIKLFPGMPLEKILSR